MVPMGELEMHAQDMWRDGVGWDLPQIVPYVPQTVRLRLMSVVVDMVTGSSDRMSWSESSDGMFTVRSAYQMLTRDEEEGPDMENFFTRVWRLLVPKRVRVFLWLATHQVLMTNVERRRRHLSDSGLCQVCKSGEETILHILRDCPAMAGIWRRLVPRGRLQSFFAKSLLKWLHHNMGDERVIGGNLWATVFGLATWWGWKWRCGNVLGVNGKCRDQVRFIKELATEVSQAFSVVREAASGVARVERQIAWSPPSEEWIKLNTDGASRGNPGLASAGGVLRDGSGVWRGGFALNIGICSAPLAELWGVYYGLYIAWEQGITRLELEVDSEIVVGFLQTGISDTHPLSFLVRLCHGFISRDWIVRIAHVYREANLLADGLANYAFTLPLGFHLFPTRVDELNLILLEDANGTTRPRSVRV